MAKRMKVESGKPVPTGREHRRYPWDRMKVGQSFFVPCSADRRVYEQSRALVAGQQWCRRNDPTVRITTLKTARGVRVWKVAK